MDIEEMIKRIVDTGTNEDMHKLSDILEDTLEKMQEENPEEYKKYEMQLYKMAYGCNLNRRNYRGGEYYEDLEMCMEDMRDDYRKLEDVAEMSTNPQEKNMLMKIAQKAKENYHTLKQMMED